MVTVELPNNTSSTISRRPMRVEPTGNDSIEAGGLPDCELNCEKISRWTTKLRVGKYFGTKLAELFLSIEYNYEKYQIQYLCSKTCLCRIPCYNSPFLSSCWKQSCWNHFKTLNFNSHFQIVSIKFGWISKSPETIIGCSIKYAMWMFLSDIKH